MLTFSRQPPDIVFLSTLTHKALGKLLVGHTPTGALCRLGFLAHAARSALVDDWQKEWPTTLFQNAPAGQKLDTLPAKPSLLLVGTPFQHKVWRALSTIPAGQTLSYGELAAHIGHPRAARAVGTALGRNPLPFLIPCHRILAGNGGLGGFTGGLPLKKKLLQLDETI